SGVVFLRQANSEIRFASAMGRSFFRATRYDPVQSECLNNLKKLRFAKELWAYEARLGCCEGSQYPSKNAYDTPTTTDLMPTMRILPQQCPVSPSDYYVNGE